MKKYTEFLFEGKYDGKDRATLESILADLVKQGEKAEDDELIRAEIDEVKHAISLLEDKVEVDSKDKEESKDKK